MRNGLIILLFLACSCTAIQQKVGMNPLPDKFVNDNFCTVEIAYKARILKSPKYNLPDNTLSTVKKGDMIQTVGFEKGYAIVQTSEGTGYISEQYFHTTIFYDIWKNNYYRSLKAQSGELANRQE